MRTPACTARSGLFATSQSDAGAARSMAHPATPRHNGGRFRHWRGIAATVLMLLVSIVLMGGIALDRLPQCCQRGIGLGGISNWQEIPVCTESGAALRDTEEPGPESGTDAVGGCQPGGGGTEY